MRVGRWGGRWDSNPRRPESQSGALPTELRPPLSTTRRSPQEGPPVAGRRVYTNSPRTLEVRDSGPTGGENGAPGGTRTPDHRLRRPMLYPAELRARVSRTSWSGQQDSNLRPSAPKADALPDCAMPRRDAHVISLAENMAVRPTIRHGRGAGLWVLLLGRVLNAGRSGPQMSPKTGRKRECQGQRQTNRRDSRTAGAARVYSAAPRGGQAAAIHAHLYIVRGRSGADRGCGPQETAKVAELVDALDLGSSG
jgi:hypothetical protein